MDEVWSHRVSRLGDTCVVFLIGDVDLEAEDALTDALLAEVRRPGTAAVQVDFDEVTFLGSSGINALLRAYNVALETGRQFHLIRVHKPASRVLEIVGLLPLLALDSGEQARKAS